MPYRLQRITKHVMKDNALSVANYFIELAQDDKKEIRPLKLMKLVYIAYGYALALLGRSIINPRFDKVEAWKFGPVIPSVYHSFKIYGNENIKQKTVMFQEDTSGKISVVTPELQDEEAKMVCKFVWVKYGTKYTDSELVTIMHGAGTPWGKVYVEGMNNPIPELYTEVYYKELVRRLRLKHNV